MKQFLVGSIFFLFACSRSVQAQNEAVVLNLAPTEFNGKVLLTWSITQGNTCNGIIIYRGSDTLNYAQIGSIEGICGSSLESIKYQFTDPNPMLNATNYYRLSLGGLGFSYPVKLEVLDTGEKSYLVKPNPLVDESLLIFANDNQDRVTISFYSERGDKLQTLESTQQAITLRREDFTEGVVIFVIQFEDNSKRIIGKFVVI